jgi:hypothetical protein
MIFRGYAALIKMGYEWEENDGNYISVDGSIRLGTNFSVRTQSMITGNVLTSVGIGAPPVWEVAPYHAAATAAEAYNFYRKVKLILGMESTSRGNGLTHSGKFDVLPNEVLTEIAFHSQKLLKLSWVNKRWRVVALSFYVLQRRFGGHESPYWKGHVEVKALWENLYVLLGETLSLLPLMYGLPTR